MSRIGRALALLSCVVAVAAAGAGAAVAPTTPDMPLYPQAGILWQDLYVNNFVDLDPEPGRLLDHACGTQTYDGHTGIDTDIRSFREMDIGVPVFAALDGEVISVQDGNFDRNHGPATERFDNHVVLEHGPGRFTIYGHLRKGISLRRGQRVVAGQQLGWTASSGSSTWPHLHFTSHVDKQVSEPFSGPCREGPSGFDDQPPMPSAPYVQDVAISSVPMTGMRDLPHDLGPRTGTFVRGARTFAFRVQIGAIPASAQRIRIRVVRPNGVAIGGLHGPVNGAHVYHGRGTWGVAQRLALRWVGRWKLRVEVDDGVLAEAPFDVVARPSQLRNRRPRPVSASILPAAPTRADVLQCRISTSLVTEDPDYQIVAFRYRWTVGGRVVRTVRSAALSDVLRRGLAAPGQRVSCSVTPTDGRLAARPSVAAVVAAD